MGGRKKSSSSSGNASSNMANAQSQVGTSTQAGTNNWLTSLMGSQANLIGQTIAPLIQGGMEMMGANPGMQNFSEATGKKYEFNQPEWLTNFAETAQSWAPQQQPGPVASEQQPGRLPPYLRVSPQQRERYAKWRQHQDQFGG